MIVLKAIWAIGMISCIYIMIRNELVCKFREKIIDMIYKGDNWKEKRDIYHNGPSYGKMVISFKRLKLESFYTPDQIEILNK